MNFIKKILKLFHLYRFNLFVKKKSPNLTESEIDNLIDKHEKILEQLGDEADYDGMGDWGRFPPIEKK